MPLARDRAWMEGTLGHRAEDTYNGPGKVRGSPIPPPDHCGPPPAGVKPSVAAGQPVSPEVRGERTREVGLDARLRLTCLAAIRDGPGLAWKTTGLILSQRCKPGLSGTIEHPRRLP
jgi:hypothetical protein